MNIEQWFRLEWDQEVSNRAERTPYPPETWRASGRASKANPDKENPDWWFVNGPEFVQTYLNWREAVGWPIWEWAEGQPAIELDLGVRHPDYEFEMRSITDRVMVMETGELVIVDIKSGTFKPPAPLQLAVNAECLDRAMGVRPPYGIFLDLRKGGYDRLWDLSHYTSEFLWDRAHKAQQIRDRELFIANPNALCASCSVNEFCHTMRGERAHEFPPHRLPLEVKGEVG